ncbi:HD superfamily phosphohydrolase [Entomoplasma ellychniae]|uniref:HD superfamily phosphohydrolase n=1 Tax=Entomoplasma ellychniae TaxID=2114 RepID=A0A8E2UCV3_9MOLU|nr:HD domain-containing protein [Entomoplasma ellychniae]PPE04772.1 HD superfamily phosphohydrolase [Entomoplasma ellychniae]
MQKVFRDSVHGDIFFEKDMFVEILNTPEMQRLRRIFQLGGSQFAFSSATHTRFMHCIGVYEVVNQFINLSQFNSIDEKEKDLIKLAGLMHDIGHGPFSHTFEKVSNKSHEEYSAEIISNKKGNIRPILEKYQINPDEVISILKGKHPKKQLNLLISSQLDADRIDYLKRDSYNCGVNYASLDTSFLIRNAKLIDDKIVYPIKTVYAIESYLLGRYHMYKQVYEHKASIAFDTHFRTLFLRLKDLYDLNFKFKEKRISKYFYSMFDRGEIPVDLYLELDDMTTIDIIKNLVKENDEILSDLANRILNRQFFNFKVADEFKAKEIKNKLKAKGLDLKYYFIEFKPKKTLIYKDGVIDGKDQSIYIQDWNGKIKSFNEFSLLANTIKEIEHEKIAKKYLFPKEMV